MAEYELKPCPFCGGEAKYENSMEMNPVIDESGAYVDADFVYWETVYCTKCKVQIFSGDNDEDEGYAIELWNRRANDENIKI